LFEKAVSAPHAWNFDAPWIIRLHQVEAEVQVERRKKKGVNLFLNLDLNLYLRFKAPMRAPLKLRSTCPGTSCYSFIPSSAAALRPLIMSMERGVIPEAVISRKYLSGGMSGKSLPKRILSNPTISPAIR